MNVLKIAAAAVGLMIVLLAVYSAWLGAFASVSVSEKVFGPVTYMYEPFLGPYSDTSQAFEKVQGYMKAEGLPASKGIGVYLDNPKDVPAVQCRSECGMIIPENALGRVPELSKKYKIKTIQKGSFLYAEFPFKNKLSFMFGPMKVYPAFSKESLAKGYAPSYSIELYGEASNKIVFLLPIVKK
jgi:DNA gyrase inhibitor GyrI